MQHIHLNRTMQSARETASNWHNGQWSALYAFASSGTIQPGLQAEVYECLTVAVAPREFHRLQCLYAATAPAIDIETIHSAREFWHRSQRNADGSPVRCRANGQVKTWKRHPGAFRLPVKRGLKECFYIDNSNAQYWVVAP